jgi:hypothetical protein
VALRDGRKDIMRATLAVRSCELNAEFCFSIPRVRMGDQWRSDLRGKSSTPEYVILEGRPRRNLEKTAHSFAWYDLLVTSLRARCWHYNSSGLSDRLKRAGELPHTVTVPRLSTRAYVFAIGWRQAFHPTETTDIAPWTIKRTTN